MSDVDGLLGELDAFDETVLLVDEGGNSSVLFLPELMAMNFAPPAKHSSMSCSALDDAYRGDAESAEMRRTKSGCGSVSLMQPMPLHPWKLAGRHQFR
ncbi:MAG: hypothetical protein ACLTQI_06075 [Slackia sp.]